MNFKLNQIVQGQRAGSFVIIGFRTIGGEAYAQVKEYNPATGKTRGGEFSLPLTALVA